MHEVMNDRVRGKPGYEGFLNDRVISLPRRLRDHGYHTYMTGKWHLGLDAAHSPKARGFERSFSLLHGGASHFSDMKGNFSMQPIASYREDNEIVDKLPTNFFSSTFYTDKMIEYIESDLDDAQPFFAYLAYTAPHWPLQAPDDYIDRYKGVYDSGWDVLREKRLAGLKRAGLMPEQVNSFPRLGRVKAWEKLTEYEKKHFARRMEVYAAMIEQMDVQIGRIINYLERKGELDNTYVVFFSDNGPEGNDAINIFDNQVWVPGNFDNSLENIGKQGSYVSQGPGWAQVSSSPLRLFKSFPSEGGIRVPAIITHGKRNWNKNITKADAVISVMDITPTLLDIAEIPLDTEVDDNPGDKPDFLPITGKSLLPYLSGSSEVVRTEADGLGWELFGRRAFRRGDWKILWLWEPFGTGRWQLYNLKEDPAELIDLARKYPGKLKELVEDWDAYAVANGVIVLDQDAGYAK